MSKWLGQLVWWRVGTPQIRTGDVAKILEDLGIEEVAPPKAIVPVDAFRRLTGDLSTEYRLDTGEEITLELQQGRGQRNMVVRVIVRTVRRDGIAVDISKVGDCAFYKPPRGQNERARMRVATVPDNLPDRAQVEAFADNLRLEYRRALTFLDSQALRRLVRQYLANCSALPLNGPYFLPRSSDADRLVSLLERIGGGSQCLAVPVVDDEPRRQMLTSALEAAVGHDGESVQEFIEPYMPLGLVSEGVWALLEKEVSHGH